MLLFGMVIAGGVVAAAFLDPSFSHLGPRVAVVGLVTGLGASAALFWATVLRRKLDILWCRRSPAAQARGHGWRFLFWFMGHTMLWIALPSLAAWAMLALFGTSTLIVAAVTGLLSCVACGLLAAIIALAWALSRRYVTLGQCWPSQVPDGIRSPATRAAATLFLPYRLSSAQAADSSPVSATEEVLAVLAGNSSRPLNLDPPLMPAWKRESLNRALVLAVVFCLAFIPGLFIEPDISGAPPSGGEISWVAPGAGPDGQQGQSDQGGQGNQGEQSGQQGEQGGQQGQGSQQGDQGSQGNQGEQGDQQGQGSQQGKQSGQQGEQGNQQGQGGQQGEQSSQQGEQGDQQGQGSQQGEQSGQPGEQSGQQGKQGDQQGQGGSGEGRNAEGYGTEADQQQVPPAYGQPQVPSGPAPILTLDVPPLSPRGGLGAADGSRDRDQQSIGAIRPRLASRTRPSPTASHPTSQYLPNWILMLLPR